MGCVAGALRAQGHGARRKGQGCSLHLGICATFVWGDGAHMAWLPQHVVQIITTFLESIWLCAVNMKALNKDAYTWIK